MSDQEINKEQENNPELEEKVQEAVEEPTAEATEETPVVEETVETAEAVEEIAESEEDEDDSEADEDEDESDDESDDDEEEEEEDVDELEEMEVVVEDDFDWDNYTSDHDSYTSDERKKLQAMFDETLSAVAEHEVVEGTVVFMNKREVVVNIGYKSEGVVSLNEFRYNPELSVGDQVEVYVETLEDKNGQLILSHKKARALKSWDRVNQSFDNSEVIKGYIKCRTKGGMIVDVFGIEAFLPGSQIDVKPIRDYDVFVGKTMEFKVVKINQEFKNVVVSHKALIEAELEVQKQEIISKLEK